MYWQERLDKTNKDDEIEEKIKEVRKDNPNYGYRRMTAMLRKQGLLINKKKVQRLIQKLKKENYYLQMEVEILKKKIQFSQMTESEIDEYLRSLNH